MGGPHTGGMCGRFTYLLEWEELRQLMLLPAPEPPEGYRTSYNLAPTQRAPVVRVGEDGAREAVMLRWGLAPHWMDDPGRGPINARLETAGEKPMFRSAMRRRRCIVPATGFFEWERRGDGSKRPWHFHPADGPAFALAGLWERHDEFETFAILTTAPNEVVERVHNRMPVILPEELHEAWLSPEGEAPEIPGFPADRMEAEAISRRVNSPRNDDPSVLAPAEGEG